MSDFSYAWADAIVISYFSQISSHIRVFLSSSCSFKSSSLTFSFFILEIYSICSRLCFSAFSFSSDNFVFLLFSLSSLFCLFFDISFIFKLFSLKNSISFSFTEISSFVFKIFLLFFKIFALHFSISLFILIISEDKEETVNSISFI